MINLMLEWSTINVSQMEKYHLDTGGQLLQKLQKLGSLENFVYRCVEFYQIEAFLKTDIHSQFECWVNQRMKNELNR